MEVLRGMAHEADNLVTSVRLGRGLPDIKKGARTRTMGDEPDLGTAAGLRRNFLEGGYLGILFYSSVFAFTFSLLLGGGTPNFYLTNAALQILTLPCLIFAAWSLRREGGPESAKLALWLIGAATLLVFLQLIPLPPAVWATLPFHNGALVARRAIGSAEAWFPISLTPDATIVGALTLLPPLAVFLGVLNLNGRKRRLLTLVPLAVGCVNAVVGLLQLSQGEDSPLYFYAYTNHGSLVGLFANRNHVAALFYSVLPFAAAWIALIVPTIMRPGRRQKYDTNAIIQLLLASGVISFLIVGNLMATSRAGVILLMVALAGSLSLQPWRNFAGNRTRSGGIFAVIIILAMMLGLQYGLYKILMRFEADPLGDARVTFARITAKAALDAAPFGTGIGSFVPIYAAIEQPDDLLLDSYVNHAHNDFLEFLLEAGVPGLALLVGFLVWFFFRVREIWREDRPDPDLLMSRAATLTIGLLLAHELVDYALRTDALLAIFAFSCALLVPPPEQEAITKAKLEPKSTRSGLRVHHRRERS